MPGGIRTPNLLIRSQLLYPIELRALHNLIMISARQYIDGRFVPSHSARTIDVINPATQEVIARVPDGDAADVAAAVAAARRAFESAPWNEVTAQERGRILFRLAQVVR